MEDLDDDLLILQGLREYLILLGSSPHQSEHINDIPDSHIVLTHAQKKRIAGIAYQRLSKLLKKYEQKVNYAYSGSEF